MLKLGEVYIFRDEHEAYKLFRHLFVFKGIYIGSYVTSYGYTNVAFLDISNDYPYWYDMCDCIKTFSFNHATPYIKNFFVKGSI